MIEPITWRQPGGVDAERFTCGYCGAAVASDQGWQGTSRRGRHGVAVLRVCPLCTGPTFFGFDREQVPGPIFGRPVSGIGDAGVSGLYEEARLCCGQGAFTAAVLCCRKLLMHIAVAKGAQAGGSFVSYVEFLADNHYVPPDARDWVDHIRQAGNEANHEIAISDRDHAEELLSFSEMLLKVIFEFPAAVKARASRPAP